MNLLDHIWLKIAAVAIAGVSWLVVTGDRRERIIERAFDVPIALVGLPRDLIITTPVPDAVNVRLRGRISALRALSSQNLEATLELADAASGEVVIPVRPQDLNIPDRIEVVQIAPAKIPFRLEPVRRKSVPIRAYPVGELPEGVTMTGITVEPTHALVSGPASLIRDFSEVVTERIVISSKTSTFTTPVGIVSDRSLVRVEQPQSVRVTISMRQRVEPPPPLEPGEETANSPAGTAPASRP